MSTAAQKTQAEPEATFYSGTSFAVGEIELGLSVLAAKVRNLKQGNTTGSAVQQKLASEDISKVAGQIKILADTLVRVSVAHLNRRQRI